MSTSESVLSPEHLFLMDEEKKWEGLIRLLQQQQTEMRAMAHRIDEMKFEISRLADEQAGISEELKEAKDKLSKVEEIRLMAAGGKAALLAAGGAIVWLLNHAFDFAKNNGK